MLYTATISSTPLRLRETRIIADLLMSGIGDGEWREAIVDKNVLQVGSTIGVIRMAKILRARIQPLGPELWRYVRDGSVELASQAALAGAIQHSRLLGDFMDLAIRDEVAAFRASLSKRTWSDYIEGCHGRDPDMPLWSDSTVAKLRSVVFSMLAETSYLKDTRSLLLQAVFVDDRLASLLEERGERYILRCLRVME